MAFNKSKALEEAARLVSQRKIPQAIRQYQAIVELDPQDFLLRNVIGDLWVREGNITEALREFYVLADSYAREGFFLKAIAIYKKIAKLDNRSITPLLKLADLYSGQKLNHEAHDQYAQALALCERNSMGDQASQILKKLVALEPGNASYRLRLAEFFGRAGQRNEACTAFLEAAERFVRHHDLAGASSALKRAGEIDPQNPQVILWRARLAVEAKQYDAVDALRDQCDESRVPAEAFADLGKALGAAGQWSRAASVFDRLQRREPENPAWPALLNEAVEKQGGWPATGAEVVEVSPLPAEKPADETGLRLPPPHVSEPARVAQPAIDRASPGPAPLQETAASARPVESVEVDFSSEWDAFHSPQPPSTPIEPPPAACDSTAESPLDEAPESPLLDSLTQELAAALGEADEASPMAQLPSESRGIEAALPFDASLGELLTELDRGSVAPADDEPPETHYYLGVAFHEMGLVDEAIGEFQKVVKGRTGADRTPWFLEAASRLGNCFIEKKMPEIAVRWYLRALEAPGLDEEIVLALTYDLGIAYEQCGNLKAAHEKFAEVYSLNIDYRDVAEKVHALRSKRA